MNISTRLGYTFNQAQWFTQALTHRSVGHRNNERLEFLGDAILNVIISQQLFSQFQYATEGELTRLRSQLVKGPTLAEIALDLGLDQVLLLGLGEKLSGGHRRESILADTLEAIIAAIYFDSNMDMETVKSCVLKWYDTRLKILSLDDIKKDSKTVLQEWLQAHKHPLPSYNLVQTQGKSHEQIFYVECAIPDLHIITQGDASTRRIAEQIAAQKALVLLEVIKNE